jgi:hypothetical protein
MNIKSVDLYGMNGYGMTVKEAKTDAIAKITRAMDGTYSPRIAVFRGTMGILTRDLDGYRYRLIELGKLQDTLFVDAGGIAIMPGDRSSSYNSMLFHMAQNGWDGSEDESPLLVNVPDKQAELKSWIRWQKSYKSLRAQGYADTDAHRLASSF